MFMNIMDGTVVNVALPTLSRSFAVPIGSVSGVVTAYLVTLAVAMPASGWIGDRFGGRNVLLGAITLFTAASALCGLATTLPELVAFRALQGLGGGPLVPVGMTMITRAFPPAERIKANQVLIVPTLLAPALGPVIGGALVDGLSWRWIFYINLPVGVAAVLVGLLFLPRRVGAPARPLRPARVPARRDRLPAGHVRAVDRLDVRLGLRGRARHRRARPGAARRVHRRRAARPRRCSGCGSTATGCSGRPACSSPPRAPGSWARCSSCRSICRTASASPPSTPGCPPSPRRSAA